MYTTNNFRNAAFNMGTWINLGAPAITELASEFPFNWILFDLEHGNITEANLLENFRAMRNEHTAIIVRIAGIDTSLISRILDWGGDGIMVPHITSPDQVRTCLEAMYYPPLGKRGFSTSTRQFGYGTKVPESIYDNKPLFFAQIEDAAGVRNAEAIAAVEGVDVLFAGPADLKLALSHQAGSPNISFEEALESIAAAAVKHHKIPGILLREQEQFPNMKALGYSCIAVGSDLAILRKGFQNLSGLTKLYTRGA